MNVITSSRSFPVSSPFQCFFEEMPYPGLCRILFRDDFNLLHVLPGCYSFSEYFSLKNRLSFALFFGRKQFQLKDYGFCA